MTRILQILNEKNFYTTKYTKKHEGFIFILRDLRDLRGKNITNLFNLCYPRSSASKKEFLILSSCYEKFGLNGAAGS